MDCYQTNRPRLSFEDQHEALLMLSLNCWPQGTLEKAGRSVDHQVTTDMAECPVSNTGAVLMTTVGCSPIQVTSVRLKNRVNTDASWCPVINTEFLGKGVFI